MLTEHDGSTPGKIKERKKKLNIPRYIDKNKVVQ